MNLHIGGAWKVLLGGGLLAGVDHSRPATLKTTCSLIVGSLNAAFSFNF